MTSTRIATIAFATSLALASGWAQAQSAGAGTARSGVEFTTGGVGLVARQELTSQAGQYNLHLEFAAAPEGEYVSDVEVNVVDARGTNVLSTRTDGPWLLARLPAGNYTVTSKYGSAVQKQQVSVGSNAKRHLIVRFPATAERVVGAADNR